MERLDEYFTDQYKLKEKLIKMNLEDCDISIKKENVRIDGENNLLYRLKYMTVGSRLSGGVLSQEEIDSLLSCLSKGEIEFDDGYMD